MKKAELIDSVAEKSGLTKADSERAINAFTDSITEGLKAGGSIQLKGFGTFSVSERAARTGINPSTKEPIQIPAKTVAKFKPGKDLADAVSS